MSNNQDSKINLGGFPPIIFISNETKKKREFEKKVSESIKSSTFTGLNLLNIKNILKESKKTEE
jgi:hypothetical protein